MLLCWTPWPDLLHVFHLHPVVLSSTTFACRLYAGLRHSGASRVIMEPIQGILKNGGIVFEASGHRGKYIARDLLQSITHSLLRPFLDLTHPFFAYAECSADLRQRLGFVGHEVPLEDLLFTRRKFRNNHF